MPRLAGLDAPGILQHVMGRDIERKEIFINDTDRSDFIDRLAALVEEDAAARNSVILVWMLPDSGVPNICVTRFVASGKKPDVDNLFIEL